MEIKCSHPASLPLPSWDGAEGDVGDGDDEDPSTEGRGAFAVLVSLLLLLLLPPLLLLHEASAPADRELPLLAS